MNRSRVGPTTRQHVHLRTGDFEFLHTAYSGQKLAPGTVIRKLVADHVDALRNKLAAPPELEEETT